MKRSMIVTVVLLAVVAGGCAAVTDEPFPAAEMNALAGHWHGEIWEIAAVLYQGRLAVDLRLADDGTWSGTIGRSSASGRAWMQHGWLVLSGTAMAADGHQQAVYYQLTGDNRRRWGTVTSSFEGRDGQGRVENSTVALSKVS